MTTTQETFSRQLPIAIAALGQHMHDHQLPPLMSIDVDRPTETITIRVPGDAEQTKWLNTLAIDGEHNEPWQGPIWIKTIWQVRLPDLGIRFRMIGIRRAPEALQDRKLVAVPA